MMLVSSPLGDPSGQNGRVSSWFARPAPSLERNLPKGRKCVATGVVLIDPLELFLSFVWMFYDVLESWSFIFRHQWHFEILNSP